MRSSGSSSRLARRGRSPAGKAGRGSYYGYGDGARERAAGYLGEYYGEYGADMAAALPVSPDELRATVTAFEEAGADELILDPTDASMDQLEGVAEAVLR